MPLRGLVAGALLTVIVLIVLTYPDRPTVSMQISTKTLGTLLPHAHEISDKVSDRQHGVEAVSEPVEVPEDMWVTEMSFTTKNAPQGIIHHFNVIRILPGDTDEHKRRTVIATAGQDTTPVVRFPSPSGIKLAKGDRLMILGMVHNPVPPLGEGGVYKDVVVTLALKGFKNGQGRFVPLYTNYALVSDSENAAEDDLTFQVPAGAPSFTRNSMENAEGILGTSHRFVADGWVVFMGAHMHAWEGGRRVDAYLNGERVRTFVSRLLDTNIPWSYRTDTPPLLLRVKKGDVFTVSATYVNEHDAPIEGAMGMAGVYYTVDQFALGSPLYQIWWAIKGWWHSARDLGAMAMFGHL